MTGRWRRRKYLHGDEADEVHQELQHAPRAPACTHELGVAQRSALDDPIRSSQVLIDEEREAGEALSDADVGRRGWPAVTPTYRGKSRWVTRDSTISPVAVAPFGPARLYVVVPSEKPEIQADA